MRNVFFIVSCTIYCLIGYVGLFTHVLYYVCFESHTFVCHVFARAEFSYFENMGNVRITSSVQYNF